MQYITTVENNNSLHYEMLNELMIEYVSETDLHQSISTPKELIPKITKSMINKLDENRFLQIVSADDEPIAFCYAKIDRVGDRGDIRPDWGYIMEFFVKKTHRRKGIGKDLVNRCESFFVEKGVENIWLTADAVTGIPFWLACDYIDTGEISLENNQQIMTKAL
ncbi:MAG: GNAT family N-acetyltransferase [Clostridia bacterium]|nr:GNAT family N-acetyltransferase [Clostridia bacterium]